MEVRMKDNIIERYIENFPDESPIHKDIITFLKLIEGTVVNLIFTHGDAFEENDNNIWLPDNLWEKL